MNAFELRLSMLTLSWSMLEAEYNAMKNQQIGLAFPTLEKVMDRAKQLNAFVSEK